MAASRLEDAERLFTEASELPYYQGPKVDRWSRAAARDSAAELDRLVLIARARLALDQNQLERANDLLDKLRSRFVTEGYAIDSVEVLVALESRLDLRRGKPGPAWRRLDEATKEGDLQFAEAVAVAAVAARLADAPADIQRRARQAAARAGVDTTVLDE